MGRPNNTVTALILAQALILGCSQQERIPSEARPCPEVEPSDTRPRYFLPSTIRVTTLPGDIAHKKGESVLFVTTFSIVLGKQHRVGKVFRRDKDNRWRTALVDENSLSFIPPVIGSAIWHEESRDDHNLRKTLTNYLKPTEQAKFN